MHGKRKVFPFPRRMDDPGRLLHFLPASKINKWQHLDEPALIVQVFAGVQSLMSSPSWPYIHLPRMMDRIASPLRSFR